MPVSPDIPVREPVVRLDVEGGDPDAPEVQRLVREVGARTFASMPDLEVVVVRGRSGRLLGSSRRPHPAPIPPAGLDPLLAPSPSPSFARGPRPSEHVEVASLMDPRVAPPQLKQVFEDTTRPKRRPLADLLDLPPGVRNKLGDPDDAVEPVRLLVEAAGLPVQVQDDVVLSEGQAIVVLRSRFGDPVTPPMLNHAYRRFIQSGASRGVVLSPGFMQFLDVRRREFLDPALLHAGPEGIQRMADAVSLGGNPMSFAAAPALVVSPPARSQPPSRKRFKGHVRVSTALPLERSNR